MPINRAASPVRGFCSGKKNQGKEVGAHAWVPVSVRRSTQSEGLGISHFGVLCHEVKSKPPISLQSIKFNSGCAKRRVRLCQNLVLASEIRSVLLAFKRTLVSEFWSVFCLG